MAVLTPKHGNNEPLEHISGIPSDNSDDEIIDVDEFEHRVSIQNYLLRKFDNEANDAAYRSQASAHLLLQPI
jgi:hypothetical protein